MVPQWKSERVEESTGSFGSLNEQVFRFYFIIPTLTTYRRLRQAIFHNEESDGNLRNSARQNHNIKYIRIDNSAKMLGPTGQNFY